MFSHILLFVSGFALGALVYDTQATRHYPMPPAQREASFCPKVNGAGDQLSLSMVSSASGTDTVHECIYK